MASEYNIITRKIEVHLHRQEGDEDSKNILKAHYKKWDEINNNLYKAANRIVSHCFFNDAYEYRLIIQSPRLKAINTERAELRKAKTPDTEADKRLKEEAKMLYKEFNNQRKTFLRGGLEDGPNPEQNSTYKVVCKEFSDIIPTNILSCLNQKISSTYGKCRKEVGSGMVTIPNFKKGLPVPFQIKNNGVINLCQRDDGSIYVKMPGKLHWDLDFGRDRSNNREIVNRILVGQYDAGDSSIQQTKSGKCFLLLVVKVPKQKVELNEQRVVGVDLGINVPLYAALNDNEYGGLRIGSRKVFLDVRQRMYAAKKELQTSLSDSTNGGRGRRHKLQALERLGNKERNWVHLQNHIYSKSVVDYAIKNGAGVIKMEQLSGFGKNKDGEADGTKKFLLRYWSFFELQNLIKYKAESVGIMVQFVNPYHTSQTCSFCGHYEAGQRETQETFICKNPDCVKGKGRLVDGKYVGINADFNAARNIAKSDKIVK